MQDLKDLTHDLHYENYRTEYMKSQKEKEQQMLETNLNNYILCFYNIINYLNSIFYNNSFIHL